MDSNGNIISFFGGIDIAIGRMIVNNPQQAEEMVNKVIAMISNHMEAGETIL
jgi:predicted aconitase with swiveling domain